MIPLKDENPTRHTPVVTIALLLACAAVYLFWQPSPLGDSDADAEFAYRRAAIPCEVQQQRPLTVEELRAQQTGRPDACGIVTQGTELFPDKSVPGSILVSMFLHGSLLHLGGNLLFLWIFGNNIEDRLGPLRYLLFYVVAGVVATLVHVALNVDSTVPLVGASGAIAGVMGAYLVWFPDAPVRTLLVFFFVFVTRIRARWILGFWFVLQFFTSPNSGVAWAAHVGGFVFGVLVARLVRRSRGARRALWSGRHQATPWDRTGGAGYGWFERS